jgi:hypothetical protein
MSCSSRRTSAIAIVVATIVVATIAIGARTLAAASDPIAGRWEAHGPHAATVFALERDPRDPQVVFAGTYFGGLYRSRDYGLRWTHIETPFSSRMVLSIAFDPLTPATI